MPPRNSRGSWALKGWTSPVRRIGPDQVGEERTAPQDAHQAGRIVGIGSEDGLAVVGPFQGVGTAVAPDHRLGGAKAVAPYRPIVGVQDLEPILLEQRRRVLQPRHRGAHQGAEGCPQNIPAKGFLGIGVDGVPVVIGLARAVDQGMGGDEKLDPALHLEGAMGQVGEDLGMVGENQGRGDRLVGIDKVRQAVFDAAPDIGVEGMGVL